MRHLLGILAANIAAVVKEYWEAFDDGKLTLAERIRATNPEVDLGTRPPWR